MKHNFKHGDKVIVRNAVGSEDKRYEGRVFTFMETTKTSGWARVLIRSAEDGGLEQTLLLHPESLQPFKDGAR